MKIFAISNLISKSASSIKPAQSVPPFQNDYYTNSLSFKSNTSAGTPLKKLKQIICPYFGCYMLNGSELNKIEARLDQCTEVKEIVKILSKYRKFMLPVEKNIYKKFAEYKNTNLTLPEILQKLYPEALLKLKLEEFNILDDVDKISLKLTPDKALEVHAKTTKCRQIILENNQEDTFKRKTLLTSLDEIATKKSDKKIFEKLKDRAIYLPTSGSSENAFIVKYASRSQQEIARRILRASLGTIEHVKPNSLKGANDIANFMLVCSSANSARANMPLPKFIERFPQVKKNCQKYIEQIISIINNFGLRGYENYPYKIKKTLLKESNSLIDLDLSSLNYTEKQAKKLAAKRKMFYRNSN